MMPWESTHDWAQDAWIVEPVGSRITCDPPPTDTDEDFLVLDHHDTAEEHLKGLGFKMEGSPQFYTGNDNGQFRSYRRDDTNVIVTPDPMFFEKFRAASTLAKRFNLMEKNDRISLFQAVLYGVSPENMRY